LAVNLRPNNFRKTKSTNQDARHLAVPGVLAFDSSGLRLDLGRFGAGHRLEDQFANG
jgi:hypothetical protein